MHLSVHLNVHMEMLTTTNLRTQSSQLVNLLKKGTSVSLVHRSQIIGLIKPQQGEAVVFKDARKFAKLLSELNLVTKLTDKQRDEMYAAHLTKKYG